MTNETAQSFQNRLQETVQYIRSRSTLKPKVGVILGSGLGGFADQVKAEVTIPYSEIPNFLSSTVEGHSGHFILGHVGSVPVAVLQGRVHYYEGFSLDSIVFPTRVLAMLGVENLLITNAAGGLDPHMQPGSFMILEDHINLTGNNPLLGPNLNNLGPRFPDMTEAYDHKHIQTLTGIFERLKINFSKGVYCWVPGPTYETPAEVRYLQLVGGQAVGMSTVPEVIVANHMGLRVAAISCVTNLAAGISKGKLSHQEVTDTAKRVQTNFCDVVREFILTFAK